MENRRWFHSFSTSYSSYSN